MMRGNAAKPVSIFGFTRRNMMFGTIGHVRLKPGKQPDLKALMDEWNRIIRPQVPGSVMQFTGSVSGQSDQVVFIALMQDEKTYRALAENPDQDGWYRRMLELIDGDVSWEDVNLDLTLNN
jgi:hypothetical protein